MDEITEEFLIESGEAVDQLDRDLVALESAPAEREILARIFRALHTIKGTCSFLGFTHLEKVAHSGEGLLAKLRDGELGVTAEISSALLTTVDAIRAMLDTIRATERDGDNAYVELIGELQRLAEGRVGAAAPAVKSVRTSEAKPKKKKRREPLTSPPTEIATNTACATTPTPPALTLVIPEPAQQELANGDPKPQGATQTETVRVDVELLDRLMDLAGELVLTRNQVRQVQLSADNSALTAASQRLNLVTAGLQEGIMLMRMQPVEALFGKFPRIVRDTAKHCGKRVRVELSGKNAELDRSLLDAIKDPLTHLIRNSVDHGVELPEARLRAGKPEEGVVSVNAVHESGHVTIEISDDGAGIPLDRVRAKAIEKGLISAQRAAELTEQEATHLIFLPGLSTAQAVTNVSGRGVGMDVVKTNVERLGGTVEVETQLGIGTKFRLKLPLTLAIVPALIVESSGERYAIPQVHLQELVLLDKNKQKLESVYDAPVFRLRDRLLPIVFLSEMLGTSSRSECMARPKSHLAVLQVNGLLFGLAVDRVVDQQEIVVKPLSSILQSIPLYSASTILGDGRVVLILDAAGIAARAHISKVQADTASSRAIVRHSAPPTAVASFLLVACGGDLRVALPLERVSRLETVPVARVERSGASRVLQHQGEIIPLLDLDAFIPAADGANGSSGEYANVVILSSAAGSVGLIVADVMDVMDLEVGHGRGSLEDGVLATTVVDERVTDIISVDWLLARANLDSSPLLRSA